MAASRVLSPTLPLNVQVIAGEVQKVARECTWYLFPFRRVRRRTRSAAERKFITNRRIELYERSQGMCELRSSPKCSGQITWYTMHACHVISRPRGGTWELDNLKAGCAECHIGWQHNGGKPCPAK